MHSVNNINAKRFDSKRIIYKIDKQTEINNTSKLIGLVTLFVVTKGKKLVRTGTTGIALIVGFDKNEQIPCRPDNAFICKAPPF